MKSTATLLSACAISCMVLATGALANSVRVYDTIKDGLVEERGGQFSAVTNANGTFYTFSSDHGAPFGFTENYTYEISNRAFGSQGGSAGSAGSGAGGAGGGGASTRSARLHELFDQGVSMASDGSGSYFDQEDLTAGLLQKISSTPENERDYGPSSTVRTIPGNEGSFTNHTNNAVEVLTGLDENGVGVQSPLLPVAGNLVPDAGATLMLLGAGLGFLAAFHSGRGRQNGLRT